MQVRLVTDSTSYIPAGLREELNISVVSLSVSFETDTCKEMEISNSVFYDRMFKAGRVPTSSQPTPHDFCIVFERIVSVKDAVLGIFISSDMSGTYRTALKARDMTLVKYPDAVIEIIDSRSNCMELGFAVLAAARAARKGEPIKVVKDEAYHVMARSRFLFVPETLEYLKKGGRIGGASALLGYILQIRPILTVINGKTEVLDKVRTKAKAVQDILEMVFKDIRQKGLGEIAVHHIDCAGEGKKLAGIIGEKLSVEVPVYDIGPVIGLHVGPGTVGVVYYTRD